MRAENRTISERLFEEYLASQGITDFDYEKEHEGKSKHPDYLVRIDGKEYIFDVKQFDPPEFIPEFAPYDPLPAVREKINQASEQFKEFKDRPCCLVLYNNSNPYVDLEDAPVMLGTMYGDPAFALRFNLKKGEADPNSVRPIFGSRGKMIRPHWSKPQNTTISAVMTLRHIPVGQQRFRKYMHELSKTRKVELEDCFATEVDFDTAERKLGIMIWENVFARIPFPRELFCGLYDVRYGAVGNIVTRVFAGAGIQQYEKLERELNPSSQDA